MLNYIDIIGAGFVPDVSGRYGNCRVYYDSSGVHHVGPLYQEWPSHPEPTLALEPEPQAPPEPEPAPDQPQEVVPPSEPVVQQSLGG